MPAPPVAAAFPGVVLMGTDVRSRISQTWESRFMVSSGDVQKRRAWKARFARYRASGHSVARFCHQERVPTNRFYYWAKRLRAARTVVPSRVDEARPLSKTRGPVVRFRWKSGAEVRVPADCLEVIRCLAECLARSHGHRAEAFQEVVVKV
jgi:hypothetical protein